MHCNIMYTHKRQFKKVFKVYEVKNFYEFIGLQCCIYTGEQKLLTFYEKKSFIGNSDSESIN